MKDVEIKDAFYLQIQREINQIQGKATTYNAFFYGIRILQIFITGLITVFSGLQSGTRNLTESVLVLGASATALIAIDTLFGVGSKRNTYKLILFELKSIRSDFVYTYINSKIDVPFKFDLYQKYVKAISFARDLIGSDSTKAGQQDPRPDPNSRPQDPDPNSNSSNVIPTEIKDSENIRPADSQSSEK